MKQNNKENTIMQHIPLVLNNHDKFFDVILVTADAYVDHPSFGIALIARYLQSLGISVAILPQPDMHTIQSFKQCRRPRLFFGVTAGNLDSMVALYTAQRKRRSDDAYSEGGVSGKRPYLPCIAYTNAIKRVHKNVPVVLGGLEASLRRIAHYDYYTDTIRKSILLDAKADMLIYGNGEQPLCELVTQLQKGKEISSLTHIRGTVVPVNATEKKSYQGIHHLPSFEIVKTNPHAFMNMTIMVQENMNPSTAQTLYQDYGTRGIVINPPSFPLTQQQLDAIYGLPFTRKAHPLYQKEIPALKVVETSITAHRGCYGGCSFCTLYLHQGKTIQSRSHTSIISEAKQMVQNRHKKLVVLSDVGGPTANMYGTQCKSKRFSSSCKRFSCIFPTLCIHLQCDTKDYCTLLASLRSISGIKQVYINSGIRYDLAMRQPDFLQEFIAHYAQGHISVAPEHCDAQILTSMHKPPLDVFETFSQIFLKQTRKQQKHYYLMPYFIIGFPGSHDSTEQALAQYMKRKHIHMQQIQEFYPIPMALATAIYVTGLDPYTRKPIPIEKKLSFKKRWKSRIVNPSHRTKPVNSPKDSY